MDFPTVQKGRCANRLLSVVAPQPLASLSKADLPNLFTKFPACFTRR
jgi:hypothetical protein